MPILDDEPAGYNAKKPGGGTNYLGDRFTGLSDEFSIKSGTNFFPGQNEDKKNPSLLAGLAGDTQPSLMQTLRPDRTYEPPSINVDSLKRSADLPVSDGQQVYDKMTTAMEDVGDTKARFQKDFKEARAEAVKALCEAAIENDINPFIAIDSVVAGPDSTKSTAASIATMNAAIPLVAGMTGNAAYLYNEAVNSTKRLTPEKQEQLIAEALDKLQETRPTQDTRAEMTSSAPSVSADKQSKYHWENMTAESLGRLFKADPEGKDQPEYKALARVEEALEDGFSFNRRTAATYTYHMTTEKAGVAFTQADVLDFKMKQVMGGQEPVPADVVLAASSSLTGYEDAKMHHRVALDSLTVSALVPTLTEGDRAAAFEANERHLQAQTLARSGLAAFTA